MLSVETGGARFHYELSGPEGADWLVLANSLGSNLHMWDKVVPRFAQRYRVLRYDMRGHGASSVPPGPYTLDQLGRDILGVLDSLGAGRVNFCGLSLGGQVAMWLSLHAPERVKRIVLANTGARILTPELWDTRVAAVEQYGMATLASASLERWFTPQFREQHPEDMSTVQAMIAGTDPRGYCACCAVLRETDLRNEIAAIEAPTLVITGTQDPATPPSDGQALCAAIPHSSYVELNTSHLSAWERAHEFADAVLAFLEGEQAHG